MVAMKLLDFATFALAIGLTFANPTSHGHVRHEKRIDSPQWLRVSRASPDTMLPVQVGFAQKDIHVGHDLLMEISDPKSKNYGKYLSAKEVGDMFRPSSESISLVREWLHNSGIDLDRHSISAGKGWLKFNATVQELESLLLTEYHIYQHHETEEEHIGCNEYHVPRAVQKHIDFITPAASTVRIPRNIKKRIKRRAIPVAQNGTDKLPWAGATCYEAVKPECIRSLYDIPISKSNISGNEFGLFEDGDYYTQEDLDLTFAAIAPYIKNGTHPILEGVDGGTAPLAGEGGVESNLDIAVIAPLIYPQDIILFQVDDLKAVQTYQGFANTFLDAIDASYCTFEGGDDPTLDPQYVNPTNCTDYIYPDTAPNPPNETWIAPGTWDKPEMCGAYKPTNVISVSYGIAESAYSYFYINRQCQEYMKLGLQGVSIIYASQDRGVASGGCIHPANVNKTMLAANPGAFSPGWPAACPYVTSVGATKINPGEKLSESAASVAGSEFYSGGGFSNHWPAQDYQKAALDSYFTNSPPPYNNLTVYGTPYYNRTGRGYPDVSAVGVNIPVYENGEPVLEFGTSASAPIFASVINLINERRIAAGKGPVGFLNKVLYEHPEAFTDILEGSNPGCGTQGFSAVKGWDPVTGLGTPKFPKLLDIFMALP